MKKFTYIYLDCPIVEPADYEVIDWLNAQGAEGWELIQISNGIIKTALFKKQIT